MLYQSTHHTIMTRTFPLPRRLVSHDHTIQFDMATMKTKHITWLIWRCDHMDGQTFHFESKQYAPSRHD